MKLQVQGREVYAYTGGKAFDTSLPCVVFVHGALNDHSTFNLLARWWAHHGYCVLAVDLPGHARSAGPALANVEEMADWLLEFMTAAGVTSAALVGHSKARWWRCRPQPTRPSASRIWLWWAFACRCRCRRRCWTSH